MKPLNIALIVLAVVIVAPLVLAQDVVLYFTANDSMMEAQGTLSPNAQFADKAGGCKLAQQAVATGDESAKTFLRACAAN
jgi:hypothetical protein